MNKYVQTLENLKSRILALEKVNDCLLRRCIRAERTLFSPTLEKESLQQMADLSSDAYFEFTKTGIYPGSAKVI